MDANTPLHFKGELREASIVVCEIFNHDVLAEMLPVPDYVEMTNQFLETGAEFLVEREGYLDECGGESLRVIFGAAVEDPAHASKACAAARRARSTLEKSERGMRSPLETAVRFPHRPQLRGSRDRRLRLEAPRLLQRRWKTVEFARRLCSANLIYGTNLLVGPRPTPSPPAPSRCAPSSSSAVRRPIHAGIYELMAMKDILTAEDLKKRDLSGRASSSPPRTMGGGTRVFPILSHRGDPRRRSRGVLYSPHRAHAHRHADGGMGKRAYLNAVKRIEYPAAIRDLVSQLRRMPGIGPRSAERIALWLVQSRDARPAEIAGALRVMADTIRPCPRCGFFTTETLCEICSDESRAGGRSASSSRPPTSSRSSTCGVFRGKYHAPRRSHRPARPHRPRGPAHSRPRRPHQV